MCYERNALESVPGCSGEGISGTDYCCDRPPNYLFYIGNNLGPDAYDLCEGDCDTDEECTDNLICHQRGGSTGLTEVPGCEGTGRRGTDYCVYPTTIKPSTIRTKSTFVAADEPTTPPSQNPTANPTISNLSMPPTIATLEPITSPTKAPVNSSQERTTRPSTQPIHLSDRSSSWPSPSPSLAPSGHLVLIGTVGLPAEAYPLDACQGDCNNDGDCQV